MKKSLTVLFIMLVLIGTLFACDKRDEEMQKMPSLSLYSSSIWIEDNQFLIAFPEGLYIADKTEETLAGNIINYDELFFNYDEYNDFVGLLGYFNDSIFLFKSNNELLEVVEIKLSDNDEIQKQEIIEIKNNQINVGNLLDVLLLRKCAYFELINDTGALEVWCVDFVQKEVIKLEIPKILLEYNNELYDLEKTITLNIFESDKLCLTEKKIDNSIVKYWIYEEAVLKNKGELDQKYYCLEDDEKIYCDGYTNHLKPVKFSKNNELVLTDITVNTSWNQFVYYKNMKSLELVPYNSTKAQDTYLESCSFSDTFSIRNIGSDIALLYHDTDEEDYWMSILSNFEIIDIGNEKIYDLQNYSLDGIYGNPLGVNNGKFYFAQVSIETGESKILIVDLESKEVKEYLDLSKLQYAFAK